MRIKICARNVINSKYYASRKNNPLNKFDGFQKFIICIIEQKLCYKRVE